MTFKLEKKLSKRQLIFLVILIFGAACRFFNLNWGSPYYFHPDERNIAGSISHMYWEKTLNPNFFAYGSFWSYLVLFAVKSTLRFSFFDFFISTDPFSRAIIFLRFLSAIQSIAMIFIAYLWSTKLVKNKSSLEPLWLPFFLATSPGLIQAAHFGTFETSLAFLYFLIFYLTAEFLRQKKFLLLLGVSLIFGVSFAVKISSLALTPIILLLMIFHFIFVRPKHIADIVLTLFQELIILTLPLLIFVTANPFAFIFPKINPDFFGTITYESNLAMGKVMAFYTEQFLQTPIIWYQLTKVFPFVLNPLILVLFLAAIFLLFAYSAHLIWKRAWKKIPVSILLTGGFFGITFFSNAILFVKWTRYIIPSLPYVYSAIFLAGRLLNKKKLITKGAAGIVLGLSLFFALLFTSVYLSDTRMAAATWAKNNLPKDTKILSEVYDMGIVPFNDNFHYSQIRLFNFYELDDHFADDQNLTDLKNSLSRFDVIVLPSERVSATRLRLSDLYPNGHWFYANLFQEVFGFAKAAQFSHPYDQIIPFFKPDESFTVFDHPKVTIYRKL